MKIIKAVLDETANTYVTGYLHDVSVEMNFHKIRPCMVVCAGGGYEMLSDREKEPPAMAWFAAGYQVFLLQYSTLEYAKDLRPLIELSRTIIMIRENSEQWQIHPDQIGVLGFSAGGHLAASLGTLWDNDRLKACMDTKKGKNRPNALILSYPVITAGEFAHRSSIDFVSGGNSELMELFSLENQVTEDTPPVFIWHTGNDPLVPAENTLLFCMALKRAGIPFECHIFPEGDHGLSMCNYEVDNPNESCGKWFALSLHWANSLFGFRS